MTEIQTPALAVSTVIFALRPDLESGFMTLWLPLVRRTREPHLGLWALPGGWLPSDEEMSAAAARTLRETTGLTPSYLEQLYTFGDVGRSPGGRVISVVYWALVQSGEADLAAVDENVQWFPADRLPSLAFDHNRIVDYALWRLRTKVEYSRIAHAFLGETFTLAQLRDVHEAVLRRALDPALRLAGVPHRPPRLYRYNDSNALAEQGPLGPSAGFPETPLQSTPHPTRSTT
jgi:8-oxo-dGTP diphosphatase